MFKKGHSGNPRGRPKGSPDRRSILRSMLEPHREELINKTVGMAKEGNENMLKLLLNHLLPAKPREESLQLPIELTGTLEEKAEQINQLVFQGDITVTEGNGLLDSLIMQCKLVEATELITRLDCLERELLNRV